MHDTPAGYRIDITDLTTGQSGSMTASKANGFGQVLFQPNAKQCHVAPYAFHPMYNSAVPRGSTWGAHTSNVAPPTRSATSSTATRSTPPRAPARTRVRRPDAR